MLWVTGHGPFVIESMCHRVRIPLKNRCHWCEFACASATVTLALGGKSESTKTFGLLLYLVYVYYTILRIANKKSAFCCGKYFMHSENELRHRKMSEKKWRKDKKKTYGEAFSPIKIWGSGFCFATLVYPPGYDYCWCFSNCKFCMTLHKGSDLL